MRRMVPSAAKDSKEVHTLEKAIKFMDNITLKVCYVAMVAAFFLMCMTTVHAIMRKFTTLGGIKDSLGLTELTMVLIVFCSLAFMEAERGHIRVDILINKFPKKFGTALQGLLLIITGVFIFLIFFAMAGNITTVYARGAATVVWGIPHWPFLIVAVVGLFVYALAALLHGFEKFTQIKTISATEDEGVKDIDITTQM